MPEQRSASRAPHPPADGAVRWIELCSADLPVEAARRWVTRPDCGAVVVFTGVVRDHSDDLDGVTGLTYEAYDEMARARLSEVAEVAAERWPQLGRVALLHRVGEVALGEPTVVVAASAPHREEAFAAARFCIDTLKETVPIWKQEHSEQGSRWAVCDHDVRTVRQ